MKGNYFIDTNIFVYCFDHSAGKKREKATEIIRTSLRNGRGFISIQVIQEFFNVAVTKFKHPMSTVEAKDYLEKVFLMLNIVYPNAEIIANGLDINGTTKYSFYDSLILASAIEAGCNSVITEDLQHGQTIQNVKIINPFLL